MTSRLKSISPSPSHALHGEQRRPENRKTSTHQRTQIYYILLPYLLVPFATSTLSVLGRKGKEGRTLTTTTVTYFWSRSRVRSQAFSQANGEGLARPAPAESNKQTNKQTKALGSPVKLSFAKGTEGPRPGMHSRVHASPRISDSRGRAGAESYCM